MPVRQSKDLEMFDLTRCRQEILFAPIKLDPLYEQAFFSRAEDSGSEYTLNTTNWD